MSVVGRIEQTSEDGRLIAVYSPDDLGAKGKIGARVDKTENVFDLMASGIPCFIANGSYYKIIEYTADYPEMASRFFWYLTDKASAYSD